MNLLSKPYQLTFQYIGSYLSQLYMNPIRTKSISSCFVAALGNYLSQRMSDATSVDPNVLFAFAAFGLLFGGTIPHYFYETASKFLIGRSSSRMLQLLLIERLLFMPAFTFFALYMISRLQWHSHKEAFVKTVARFPSVVEANLKYLSLLQYINVFFVPRILKVLVSNIIMFFWLSRIYQTHK